MNTNKVTLLVIDAQNDFCDPVNGTLFVPGGDVAMKNLSIMVKNNLNRIDSIHATLDSHSYVHIAHPIFWCNSNGVHPTPFTVITVDDVNNGVWRAFNPSMQQWAKDYVQSLADNNRYALTIWNYHCLIASKGAALDNDVFDAFCAWEKTFKKVNYVPKGSNFKTEHYSAVKADVQVSGDPSTMLNMQLIQMLKSDNDILICGLALDFCVNNTIRDISNEFSDEEVKKFVLLTDATASVNVPGLEHLGSDFIRDMTARGMRVSTTTEYFK